MKLTPNWLYLMMSGLVLGLVACNSGALVPSGEPTDSPDAVVTTSATTLVVDPDSQEVDARGIPVGFTAEGRPYRGDPAAPVLMEEFSDYECPFCSRFRTQTFDSLDENWIANGDMVLVYYDFPLSIHPQAIPAAHAARCAGEQGAANYWAMHDALFANPSEWSQGPAATVFSAYAADLGLDADAFTACTASGRHHNAIQEDVRLGQSRGVNGTPAFFINDQFVSGAQPLAVFNQYIDAALAGEKVVAATPGGQTAAQAQPGPGAAPTPASLGSDFAFSLGDPDAPVTIIEFTDYQCPFCARHSQETMPLLIREMVDKGQVYYGLKDLPLDSIHGEAREAAVAARCAGEQDAYQAMHDALFADQGRWSGQGDAVALATFAELAGELALDQDAFTSCLESGRHEAAVQANAAEASALGVSGTPYFFINGYPLNGARPYDTFALAVGAAAEGRLAELYVPQQQPQAPAPPTGRVDVPAGDAPFLGEPDAPVVIVEYSDFQCPFCARHQEQTMPLLLENYIETGRVKYVFKNFTPTFINPSYHPQAVIAAEAALCARDQGAFWAMHDLLFARQNGWANGNVVNVLTGYAAELGLDQEQFAACLESHEHQATIRAELDEGQRLGVRGTPGFFINGIPVSGAQPFSVFEQAIAAAESE